MYTQEDDKKRQRKITKREKKEKKNKEKDRPKKKKEPDKTLPGIIGLIFGRAIGKLDKENMRIGNRYTKSYLVVCSRLTKDTAV